MLGDQEEEIGFEASRKAALFKPVQDRRVRDVLHMRRTRFSAQSFTTSCTCQKTLSTGWFSGQDTIKVEPGTARFGTTMPAFV